MEVWRFIFYKLCGKIQNKYFKKEDRKKRKKQMIMMMMKKMRMMMMRRKYEDDEETLIGSPSSPDLRTLSMMPTTTLPRRNLIRRIADAVAGLARSVTAAVAGTPDNVPINNVSRTNRDSDNTAKESTSTMRESAWWAPSGPTAGTAAGTTTHLCLCKKNKKYKK